MNSEDRRKEFMQDLHNLLETHKRFCDDPFYEDYQGDAYDFVLNDCQNIYAKWVHNCNCNQDGRDIEGIPI